MRSVRSLAPVAMKLPSGDQASVLMLWEGLIVRAEGSASEYVIVFNFVKKGTNEVLDSIRCVRDCGAIVIDGRDESSDKGIREGLRCAKGCLGARSIVRPFRRFNVPV